MVENLPLNIIYSFKSVNALSDSHEFTQEQNQSYYQILYCFSEKEKVDWNWLKDLFEKFFGRTANEGIGLGPFENLSEINQLALKVCSELQSPLAYLLCITDYNLGLESVSHTTHFANIFSNYGKKLVNPNARSEKTNFFKRIFKDS